MIRKRPRQVLTNIQEKRLHKILAGMGVLLASWLIFAPNMGCLALKERSSQIARLEERKNDIEAKNKQLRSEIDRWKDDPNYVEKVARESYGFMKKEEVMVEFK